MTAPRMVWLGARGFWDHGLLMRAAQGQLWPEVRFEEEIAAAGTAGTPAVVVIPGRWMDRDAGHERLVELLGRLDGYVLFHGSDEESTYQSDRFRTPPGRTWVQTPMPGRAVGDRRVLMGPAVDLSHLVREVPRQPLADRPLRWSFAGQHGQRDACLAVLRDLPGGDLLVTRGFGQGRTRAEHMAMLTRTAMAPCPAGNYTPDTFRLYEALAAGCVPVCERRSPHWPASDADGYWRYVLGEEPFPCVEDWREFPALLRQMESDPTGVQAAANRAGAWWIGYQRHFALALADDVAAVGGTRLPQHPITVLMPTSVIPPHPDTGCIEDTLARVRSYPELRQAEIIIMVDGLHPIHADKAARYEEYKRRLIDLCAHDPRYFGCLPLVFSEHTHQANMMRRALELVRSPYVLYIEHDVWPVGEIPWADFVRVLEQHSDVNAIRLHGFARVLPEHQYLMIDSAPRDVGGVPLLKTRKWSQQPHLARTNWYRWLITEFFGRQARTMIEDVFYVVVVNRPEHDWGIYLYAPPGDQQRIKHTDAREDQQKEPLLVAYDGETPAGAPAPGPFFYPSGT